MRFSLNNNEAPPFAEAEDPSICPHCHHANEPRFIFKWFDEKGSKFFTFCKCNYKQCGKIFIASNDRKQDGKFYFERFLNGLPKGPSWPVPILNLKDGRTIESENVQDSKFIITYQQSLEAESLGFDEIAGMGFRKSIEYLVKDWAIQSNPAEKSKILSQWLSGIIDDYYSGDLKEILQRATWLGNDQAHYNKLFEEFNISHLKELIDLIMVELDREYKKRLYIENIEKRK